MKTILLKDTGRKTLSWVLTLAMVITLIPMMGVTSFADDEVVQFVGVKISENGEYTFSLKYSDLKDSYPVNLSETGLNDEEYFFGIEFTDDWRSYYQVATSHFKLDGDSTYGNRDLYGMQTDLWKIDDEGGGNVLLDVKVTLKIVEDTLNWTFTMPDEFNKENAFKTRVRVHALDYSYDKYQSIRLPSPKDTATKVVLSDNLNLKDMYYKYEPGEDTYNQGSLGLLHIHGLLTGPEAVNQVLIASWTDSIPTESQAKESVEFMISIWKESEQDLHHIVTAPFPRECGGSRPVYEKDLGKTQYVIFAGLDTNTDYVGYAVVEVVAGNGVTPTIPDDQCKVTVTADGIGTVTGTGTYKKGDTVTVTATTEKPNRFIGWKVNGKKVSERSTYSFVVEGDTEVEGEFWYKESDFEKDDKLVVVSLGDSYSAGEGIEPFYDQDLGIQKIYSRDWQAHRSTESWPGRLKFPSLTDDSIIMLKEYKTDETDSDTCEWYFVASSGAITSDIISREQPKEVTRKFRDIYLPDGTIRSLNNPDAKLPKQIDVFNDIHDPVDYVTLTIGGNDVDFQDVIVKCAHSSYLLGGTNDVLDIKLSGLQFNIGETLDKIKKVYEAIERKAPDAEIIVAGYPQLLDRSGKGLIISKEEAGNIDDKVEWFDEKLKDLVKQCKDSGMHIRFVDVQDEFKHHAAYSNNPWINPITWGPRSEDIQMGIASAYSIHPNEEGAKAYARCIQEEIAKITGVQIGPLPFGSGTW